MRENEKSESTSQGLKVDREMGEVSIMIWENFCRNLRRKRDLELFLRIGKLNVNQSRYRRGADESEIKAETPNIYDTLRGRKE